MVISVSRRERKKQQTRERIVRAGLSAFAKHGFEGATIDAIAAAADVGKGTVYNYFRTKEEIVVAFLVDVERRTQREVARLAHRRGSMESILTRYILFQFELKEPYHPFVRVFLAELAGRATFQSPWLGDIQAAMDPPLRELFTALRERAAVRPDLDLAMLAGAFKVMQMGLTVLWAMEGPPWSTIPGTVRDQVRVFCSGIEVRR